MNCQALIGESASERGDIGVVETLLGREHARAVESGLLTQTRGLIDVASVYLLFHHLGCMFRLVNIGVRTRLD